MSAQPDTDPEFTTIGVDAPEMETYADITLENEEVLVYDRDNEEAWVQSDVAFDLSEVA